MSIPATPAPPTTESFAEAESLGSRRRLLELGILGALVAGAVVALPGLGGVRDRLADADPRFVALAAALELGSCLAFVLAFRGVFSRRLGWGFSYQVGMAEQAANVLLPTGGAGGLALGAWALRRVGMDPDRIGRRTVAFFLLTSSVNFLAVIVAGVGVATGLLAGDVAFLVALGPALAAALAISAVALMPSVLDRPRVDGDGRARRLLRRAGTYAAGGIRDAGALIRSGRPAVVGGAVGYMGFDLLALAAMFAAVGGEAPELGIFVLAYALGQLGGLIPLPGGIGGTDGGLVAAFVLLGTPIGPAAAAVIAYRGFQLGVPALLGVTAFAQLRRRLATAPAGPVGARTARGCPPPVLEPEPA